jgi:hypothetical protein
LDETDGNIAADSSCYQRDGYVDVNDPCEGPNWDPNGGRYGGCLVFDDDTAVIVPNDVLSDINQAITITVWLKDAYREDGDNWVFDAGAGDFRVQAAVVTEPEREVLWRAGNDTNDVLTWDLDGIDPSWLTDWYPWAFVKDETGDTMSIHLYVSMFPTPWCLKASKTGVSKSLVNVRNTPFKIGALTDHDNDFVGQMDDFRVYECALSEDEICPIPPPPYECAWAPSPYDGQPDAAPDVVLTWRPGDYAVSHDVYFGTSWGEVNDANSCVHPGVDYENVTETTYDPGLLELDQTYFWRVDEVNEPNIWKCRIWRFTTADHVVIDDMEEYTAGFDSEYPITHHVGLYGWDCGPTNGSGSLLGLQTVAPVRDQQSMLYYYENDMDWGPGYSEISNHFELDPNDWTVLDVKILSLWLYGDPNNDANDTEQMFVALEDTSFNYQEVGYGDNGEDMNDIRLAEWQEWNIPLDNFTGVNLEGVKYLYIGFGDRSNPLPGGGGGIVHFDDIRLYPPICVPEHGPEGDLNNNCIVDFADVEIMARDWLMTDRWLLPRPPEPAVGWWKLDEGEGDVATDHAGYDNNGVIETIDVDVWWVAGRYGNALEFDGGRVRVPDAEELRPMHQVSASTWIYYSGQQEHSARVVVKGADNKETYSIEINDDDEVVFLVRDVNGTRYAINSNDIYRDQWMHLVGTYDGNSVRCYVNGQLEGINNDANGILSLSQDTNDLAIGNRSDATNREFLGIIDDVQVYDYGLAQAEILYIGGWPPIYIPLESIANIYDEEPPGAKGVNFRDFAVLADSWLAEQLWPLEE